MCPNCAGNTPASTAVNTLVNFLEDNRVKYGMLWYELLLCHQQALTSHRFDVEQCTNCWSTNLASNMDYLNELVSAAVARKVSVGIYSSSYEWGITVGSTSTGLQKYPLWYAHYDGKETFSDFVPFGGWTKPAIKQYNDHGDSSCNIDVDVNWYP